MLYICKIEYKCINKNNKKMTLKKKDAKIVQVITHPDLYKKYVELAEEFGHSVASYVRVLFAEKLKEKEEKQRKQK